MIAAVLGRVFELEAFDSRFKSSDARDDSKDDPFANVPVAELVPAAEVGVDAIVELDLAQHAVVVTVAVSL